MGVYYMKEDIIEYISKNIIIFFLFDVMKKECEVIFCVDGEIWLLLKENLNWYIYDVVLKGVDVDLLLEIVVGINDVF